MPSTQPSPPSQKGAQAVTRAIQLLKLFGGKQSALTLNEIVELSQLNKTTAFRLLAALESEGLLERCERQGQSGYRLGPEMVSLGSRAIQQNGLIQVSEPILEELMQTVNERVTLEQPIVNHEGHTSMLLLLQVHSGHMIGINQVYGTRLPLHATSTGKAYLAFLEGEARQTLVDQTLIRFTKETIIDRDTFDAGLELVRQQGYAIAVGELETGLLAIGAPIFNYTGKPVAAISIEAPDSRINTERLHEMAKPLVKAAKEISQRLGYIESI